MPTRITTTTLLPRILLRRCPYAIPKNPPYRRYVKLLPAAVHHKRADRINALTPNKRTKRVLNQLREPRRRIPYCVRDKNNTNPFPYGLVMFQTTNTW